MEDTKGKLADIKAAPLTNVQLFDELIDRLQSRDLRFPGIGIMHGPAGFGKTTAAIKGANRHNAHYVEPSPYWGLGKFCRALATEIGVPSKGTISDVCDRIIEDLSDSRRPLIIDEFDHVLNRNYHETVRDIQDKTKTAVILIGEEMLPHKLARLTSDRFHSRVFEWVQAKPASESDTRQLAKLYCPEIKIKDDLLDKILTLSKGRARRISVNLDRVRQYCISANLKEISAEVWGDLELYTGQQPQMRTI